MAAWRLLLSAFVFEALLWGLPLSFGVFQNYYTQLPQFKDDPYVSVIGIVASGLTYMAAPIIIPFTLVASAGSILLLCLIAGSFATTNKTLVLTLGVMYGLRFPINEFWIARRGMAYGLVCAASGVSGAVFPFAIEKLLVRYGFQTTLRSIANGLFVLTGPLLLGFKGRLPESDQSLLAGPIGHSLGRICSGSTVPATLHWAWDTCSRHYICPRTQQRME
ncbi:uncharacterized protein A1O5_01685 [Cladophialophora psammophila CBS 110553]|uniref:Major facilitator superfamily (MFS) profile domain-containing protein n=1 Tax=Cladophialophora psammophila CBS 110553 TaxID=1182543 RepID=W9XXK0_9EURO|nr:uncharacterized protein A1O5_01685 [Cladophialophora psammophila CBS 110553]EXJ74989.1 hypothetical protein A1O5_01685 [Cladophialophora psammophila CBS 110553]